jgi:hypothetical protein
MNNKMQALRLQDEIRRKARDPDAQSKLTEGASMKYVRVKSNFARDRVITLGQGQLVLHFDSNGYAQMPRHHLPLLEAEQRVRPGRYNVEYGPEPKPTVQEIRISDELTNQIQGMLSFMVEEPAEEVEEKIAENIPDVEEVKAAPKKTSRRRKPRKSKDNN